MNPTDAFGIAALAYYLRLRPDEPIVPDLLSATGGDGDTGGISGEDPMAQYFQTYDQMNTMIKGILDWTVEACPTPKRVLDIGCGVGRFIHFFEERGYEVLGIDTSPGMVWVCERFGLKGVQRRDWKTVDPNVDGQFDIILLLGSNIGIGRSPEGVDDLLEAASRWATDGGFLLVNSKDVELIDKVRERNRVQYNKEHGRYPGQTAYQIRFGPYHGEPFDWIFVKAEDFRQWAGRHGWIAVKIMEGTDPEHPERWAGVFQKLR